MYALCVPIIAFWPFLMLLLRLMRLVTLSLVDDSVGSRKKLNETCDSWFIMRVKFLVTETTASSIWIHPRKNRNGRALSSSKCDMFALATMLVCLFSFSSKGANACCDCLTPWKNCTKMWVLIDVKVENDLLMLFTFSLYRSLNRNAITSIPDSFVQELTALQELLVLT